MEPKKEYYAFISYKREDEHWARWLQHKLEHYKLPSNLNGRTDLPREIRPVFRDTSELNPGNLPQQIHNALATSKNLIVICSPRSAQSEWVNLEIETFIAMGKQDSIIPFIVDGHPFANDPAEECFPPAIRNLPKEQELLGANVNEMGRDAAAVKTVAQMFGVRFDTLWKRFEREQRRKRMLIIIAVALFVIAVLGVAGYIWRQNTLITKSRADLQTAYNNLTAANAKTEQERTRAENERDRANQERDRAELAEDSIQIQYNIIEQTYNDLRRSTEAKTQAQSRAAAEAALKLVEEGDSYRARKVALAAYRISPTVEAEAALRQACTYNTTVLTDFASTVTFNPNNKCIYAQAGSRIHIWSATTGQCIDSIHIQSKNNHDGNNCFMIGSNNIYIFKKSSKKNLDTLIGHTDRVNTAFFSPDGNRIVSASKDKTIRIWDYNTGKQIGKPLEGHSDEVLFATFSPDGNQIVSTSKDKSIRIWNAITGENIHIIKGQEESIRAKLSPDCNHVVSISANNTIYLWDVFYEKCIDICKGHLLRIIDFNFSSDGLYVVSASVDGTIRLWDISQEKPIKKITDYPEIFNSAVYSPDGKKIFSTSDNYIQIIDATTGKKLVRHEKNEKYKVFYSNSKRIIFKSENVLNILDALTGDSISTFTSDYYNFNTNNFNISQDDRFFVYAGLFDIKIWDASTKKIIRTLKLNNESFRSACFNSNGNRIVASSFQGNIYIIDVATGNTILKISGHTSPVNSSTFSSDDKYIVSTSNDNTIKVWDATTGICLQTIKEYPGLIKYAVFSPNGRSIVSTSFEGIKIWDFPPIEDLIKETEERFKEYPLTPEERRKYYLE